MLKTIAVLVGCVAWSRPRALRAQPVGLGFYDDLSLLPNIYSNVQSYYLSSYDRTGGNDDGFRGTYSQLYVDDNGEHVIFDENGPGCVYNLWFTGDDQGLHWGKIRIYFDGEKTARSNARRRAFRRSVSAVRSAAGGGCLHLQRRLQLARRYPSPST